MEKMPPWERQSMGFERAWERAREWILELESRGPSAGDKKPSVGRRSDPTARATCSRADTTPTRIEVQSKPASPSDAAAVDPTAPASTTSDRGQEDTGRAIDAALEDLGADREADGPLVGGAWDSWDELAKAQHPGVTRALVAVVASVAVAGTGWTSGREMDPTTTFGLDLTRQGSKSGSPA